MRSSQRMQASSSTQGIPLSNLEAPPSKPSVSPLQHDPSTKSASSHHSTPLAPTHSFSSSSTKSAAYVPLPHPVHPDDEEDSNILLSIPPPAPYDVHISNLSIALPKKSGSSILPWPSKRNKTSERNDEEKGRPPRGDGNIIRKVSGKCLSGEVLAIIGGSGSGKTTLLNALAGRLGGLPVSEGSIEFSVVPEDGATAVPRKKSRILGFVRQQDYLLPHLTVLETLSFSASLRLPSSISPSTRTQIVSQTIDELGLRSCMNTLVGGGTSGRKGISGGERRRLSIGCALVTLPSVLVLDEPTSGLDAFTSHLLLLTLRSLSRRNRTVILSLHSPRSDAFALFDRLMVLSKGDVVYSGRTDRSLQWFAERGYALEKGINPLDFLIDVSSVDNRSVDVEEASKGRVKLLVEAWRETGFSASSALDDKDVLMRQLYHAPVSPFDNSTPTTENMLTSRRRPGFATQTVILIRRAHLNVYRNYNHLLGLLFQATGVGLLLGVAFYGLGDNPTDIQSLKSLCFQFVPSFFYIGQVYWIYHWCETLAIFDREREDGLYMVVPFVLSEFCSLLLPMVIPPTIYAVILYLMANLRRDNFAANIFIMILDAIMNQMATVGIAFLGASVQRSFALASVICNAASLFQTMSGGYLVSPPPPWVKWIMYISNVSYSFRMLVISQFQNRTFNCDVKEFCDGNAVLNGLGINPAQSLWLWFPGLVGIVVVEFALGALALQVYHAGGVKHAAVAGGEGRGKESTVTGNLDIPRETISIKMHHLNLSWSKGKTCKVILDDLTGKFPAGEVTAILGPSGAGKTSLLQVLAHRKLSAGQFAKFKVNGSILFNGHSPTQQEYESVGFVDQEDDYHLSGLTVRETLRFAAVLRLPSSMSKKKKIARAEEVLLMLGLKDCASVLVGGPLVKGISGGEKRRLSLAVQMINDPSILICDEPTSGLDSFTANNVMECLKQISKTGRTVICTIHQPRSDIFALCDNILVLAEGGKNVFFGPRDDVIPVFAANGFDLPSVYFNPADHILDVVSVDQRPQYQEHSQKRVQSLIQSWANQVEKEEAATQVEMSAESSPNLPAVESITTSTIVALPVLLSRMFRNSWRQGDIFWNRLTQTPILGVIFLIFYCRLSRGPEGGQNRIGVTLENVNAIPFVGLLNGIAIFPQDRDLYLHEYHSAARYSAVTFVLAFTCFELPFQIMSSLLYGLIMNVAVGLQTSVRIYFEFCVTIFLLQNFGESLAIIFASFSKELGISVAMVSVALSVVIQISGFISLSTPNWLAAISWMAPVKGSAKLQFINECIGLVFNCDVASITSGKCIATSGESLLQLFNFRDLATGKLVAIACCCTLGWRLMAYAAVRLKLLEH